jgi:transketolase
MLKNNLDSVCMNTIRLLSADMVEQAKSGHPGMPMGATGMAYVLWTKFLKHNPQNPEWVNRDRFVLSAGHGSALLYSLLHLTGYDLPMSELQKFRQFGSQTPGHPEYGHTIGVETTTGPLGQGFATGVGMALAEKIMAGRYNKAGFKIIDHYIYGIVSDGDLMEGVSSESASYAGNLGLGKLIYLYDSNRITIEGSTDLTFTENVEARFKAYNWQVLKVKEGNDLEGIEKALKEAKKDERPTLIIVKTQIGFGSPNKINTAEAHGSPLGEEELKKTRENLGWHNDEHFFVPDQVLKKFRKALETGKKEEDKWQKIFKEYQKKYAELAKELVDSPKGDLPKDLAKAMPSFAVDPKGISTRVASGQVINAIAPLLPNLIGGSADLGPSNNTTMKNFGDIVGGKKIDASCRNLHFGVREHAMGAVLNGLALSKNIIPYGGTFLIFSDYMRPAMRLSALMKLRVIYVFTHDSIGQGEDGPTHQPVEHLMSLRAMPNMTVIRPADASEVVVAWQVALENKTGPTALVLSRQNLPVIDRTVYSPADGLRKGAYVLNENIKNPKVILIATGSEVQLALEASIELSKKGVQVRVVSMPSFELFEKQSEEYKESVLPSTVKARVSIEAGATLGWCKYAGEKGRMIGLDHFGASAPGGVLMREFGFTVERVVGEVMKNF